MDELHTIPFEIRVMDSGTERTLTSTEQAVIQLTEEYKGYVTSVSQDINTIKIVPGRYKLKTFLMQASSGFEIQIKSSKVEHCIQTGAGLLGFLGFTKTQCSSTEIPATTLPQVIKGGSTSEWILDSSELQGSNKIIFYIPSYKTPTTYDELNSIYTQLQTEKGYFPSLE